jgi:hypothetical protein
MQAMQVLGSHVGGGPASIMLGGAHAPPLHTRPVDEQSMQLAPPVPHVAVDCPPTHCPAVLQHPLQLPLLHCGMMPPEDAEEPEEPDDPPPSSPESSAGEPASPSPPSPAPPSL